MNKSVAFFLMVILSSVAPAYGQSQILQKINEIKSQSDVYYWNQYAHPNADTARVGAAKGILIEINVARGENEQLTLDDILDKVKHIKMVRSGVVRNFAYIAKAEVGFATITTNELTTRPSNYVEQTKTFVPDIFVQKIMDIQDFKAVYNYLRTQKAEGTILQFGPLKDVEDYSSLDLILFDLHTGKAICLLSGVTSSEERTNLLTGQPDSLNNYPEDMTAVIWYIKN